MKKINLLLSLLFFLLFLFLIYRIDNTSLRESDLKLYDVVGNDFLNYLNKESPDIKHLEIVNKTVEGKLSAPQIKADLRGDIKPPPPDVTDNLISRNNQSVSIVNFKPTSPDIVIASDEMTPVNDYPVFRGDKAKQDQAAYYNYWKTKKWVNLFLPGYSRDRKTAIVRFLFGPEPHGAAGTYILKCVGQEWIITGRVIRYYM